VIQYLVPTNFRPSTIAVTVRGNRACTLWLQIDDAHQGATTLHRRQVPLVGGMEVTLLGQLPITRQNVLVSLWEETPSGVGSFEIVGVHRKSLPRQMRVIDFKKAKTREWIPFVEAFCFFAGVLPTYSDRHYISADGNFRILYSPAITDNALTPARVNRYTGVFEVSKQKFLDLTVTKRLYIMHHEFSHLNLNEDMNNEEEADLNGLVLGLASGFSRVEAKDVYLDILQIAPDPENVQRYEKACAFIDDYEKIEVRAFEHL
jgi:hypothetical protein